MVRLAFPLVSYIRCDRLTLCERCKKRKAWSIHHRDGDSSNDESDNLLRLCGYCHAILEKREPHLSKLRVLCETFKDFQEVRKATKSRVMSYEKKWGLTLETFDDQLWTIKKAEKEIRKKLVKEVRSYEIFDRWLAEVRGIAEITAAQLIALIDDIGKFDSISSLWSYVGLSVKDGKAPSREKGRQISYNPRLKDLCLGVIGVNFLRQNSSYRKFYDEKKEYYKANRGWTDNHCHRAAIRYMVKEFLKHFWVEWREIEGLATTKPHPDDKIMRKPS